ncbi:MAG: acyltransferase 3 [Flaviaesturariibacter sp.]|nr:acyltransferase 3 [Flaviaesturariibacter sp.]
MPFWLQRIVHNLTLGVDLFFVISGFLIVYLLVNEKKLTNTIGLGRFYIRRTLRIFPLYFVIVALAFFLYRHEEINYFSFLTFTGNFWLITKGDWTVGILNPLWSLCIEEHFYLVIPLLIAVLPHRLLPYLFGFIIIGSIGFRWYAFHHIQWPWMTLYCHTLSRCDFLAIGGLIAYRHHYKPFSFRWPKFFLWASIALLLCVLMLMDNSDFTTLWKALFKKYIFIAPLLILFFYMVFTDLSYTEPKIFRYLGSTSYGLYMYHTPIIELISRNAIINDSAVLKLMTVIILTVVTAGLSFYYFERPLLKMKEGFEVIKT